MLLLVIMCLWPSANCPCCPMALNSKVALILSPAAYSFFSQCLLFKSLSIRPFTVHNPPITYKDSSLSQSELSLEKPFRTYMLLSLISEEILNSYIFSHFIPNFPNYIKIKAIIHRLPVDRLCSLQLYLHFYYIVTFFILKLAFCFNAWVHFHFFLTHMCSNHIIETS